MATKKVDRAKLAAKGAGVAKTASTVMRAIRGAESKANMRVGASGQDRHAAWDAAHKLAKKHGAHPSDLAHIRENLRAEKQALSNKRVGKVVPAAGGRKAATHALQRGKKGGTFYVVNGKKVYAKK